MSLLAVLACIRTCLPSTAPPTSASFPYEGFGLPPLEAMACGTPVVCSNTSSLPEVASDAALLVEPTDVRALAAVMERALTDEALRASLRARGLERARRFTWEEAAREALEVYREVLRYPPSKP